jgi:hypothetical protein
VAVSKITGRLGLTETGIRVFKDNDANKQRAATTTQGIYEDACLLLGDSEGEEKLFALADFSASFLQVTFRIRASPAVYCWTVEMMIHVTRLQFKREYLLHELSLSCQIAYFFCENIISTNIFFSPLK